MYKNHNNVTPSVENMGQKDTCDVVADTATSRDNPRQTGVESFEHAENDSVHTIAKRPTTRASMCAPAITAYGKTHSSADNEKQAALKTLLDRGARTPLPDITANADASFRSLFTPVSRKTTDTEEYEKNTPVLNVADIPANVSLASLAAARKGQGGGKNQTKPKTEITENLEETGSAAGTSSGSVTHTDRVLHEMFEGHTDAVPNTEQPTGTKTG